MHLSFFFFFFQILSIFFLLGCRSSDFILPLLEDPNCCIALINCIQPFLFSLYYRKRGSASYIVREVQSVRERETEVVRRK